LTDCGQPEAAGTSGLVAYLDSDVNVLGADIARQCVELGELDEVLGVIAPARLGDGTRMVQHPGGRQVPLERLSVETVPHATNVWMRILR
jgi:hypothetical protein